MDRWTSELDELLSESLDSVAAREREGFDQAVAPFGDRLALFGAGSLGRQVAARLRSDGIEPLAFVDNNPARWGAELDGLTILSPEDAVRRLGANAAFVVTIWSLGHRFIQTRAQLIGLGCRRVVSAVPLRWKYSSDLLPFFWLDRPSGVYRDKEHVRAALELFKEDFSRQEYLAQIRFRALGDFDRLSDPVSEESYFPTDLFELRADERFVDGGAYDGVTVRALLARAGEEGGYIAAFEPDPGNFSRLKECVKGLSSRERARVQLDQRALSNRRERLRFEAKGDMGSAISATGSIEVEAIPLDDVSLDPPPTFIKMDIEGAEPAALAGARRIIERHRPLLAICLYHQQDHLWSIPLQIAHMSDAYEFFLRPHEEDGWQLVCYAIPRDRLKNGQRREGGS